MYSDSFLYGVYGDYEQIFFKEQEIESIVTKEQFNLIEYKVYEMPKE